ncbi:hypothetical protein [Prosthecobacter sp.]|uniref:hypothetical protein n=1 Tax=Prosthecobacter sp. TaxID=1965333 RepID=UPI003783C49F
MLSVHSIPERVLRSLPAHVPGHPDIRISNCQGPVGSDDPTPSTFFFDKGRFKIVLQIVDVQPRQSAQYNRLWFFVLLERQRTWLAFLQNRFCKLVRRYLQSLGATDTGEDLSDFLSKLQSAN